MPIPSTPSAHAEAVRFDRYGGREVLSVRDVPMPRPGAGEILVEVRAAGINPGEALIRSGVLHERLPATFPSGQGTDLAGVVLETGPDVANISIGDEVLGYSWTRSSHASHTVVPAHQLVHKPEALSWEVAGALDVAGTTAYAAVRAVDPKPGAVVAVSAATGGVGTLVVQLLVQRGATVLGIASASSARGSPNTERFRSLTATASADASAPRPRTGSTHSSTYSDPNTCTWPSTWVSRSTGSRPSSPLPMRSNSASKWPGLLPSPSRRCRACSRN